jgi:predicted short-subunit dehydrogenase-like oxidoreductase (DUF2520 family)
VIGHACKTAGHEILIVAGRNDRSVSQIAEELRTKQGGLNDIPEETEILLLAVSDDSIVKVSEQIPATHGVVAHCSGSIGIDVIKKHPHHGVFYPLDSFSAESGTVLSNTPILIEGSDQRTTGILLELASSLSERVIEMDSKRREQVHLTAVFYNNFINHISGRMKERLEKDDIELTIFDKLISTTILSITSGDPYLKQTGPASRNDRKTIERHLELLKDDPDLAAIYSQITTEILKRKNKNDEIKN